MTLEARIKKDARKLERFKNKYKKKRCFIIGNGPSLQTEDLDKLHMSDEYSFGSNGIHLAFEQTKWRPTFYTLSDCKALREWYQSIKHLEVKYKFFADSAFSSYNLPLLKNCYIYRLVENNYYPFCPDFSSDISKYVGNSYTVTYISLQIAAYMGFSEMYLLGVDHDFAFQQDASGKIITSEVKNYFIDNYNPGNKTGFPRLYLCDKAYIKADTYSRFHGFRIYNATRGGKLEFFERVDFDSITFNQRKDI